MSDEYITLKWGGLKGWNIDESNEPAMAALKRYFNDAVSGSAMMQKNTEEQKRAMCDLIDASTCEEIYLDWDGKTVSKQEGKDYIMNYGVKKP